MSKPLTFLCISTFFKGDDFLRACKKAGNTVYLLTKKELDTAPWPRESIDEFFYLESDANSPENFSIMAEGMAWMMRDRKFDRIVALDMLVAVGIGFIAAIGVKTNYYLYIDIAIALGLVGFLSTVAFARFVLRHGDDSEFVDANEAAKAKADAKRALEGAE